MNELIITILSYSSQFRLKIIHWYSRRGKKGDQLLLFLFDWSFDKKGEDATWQW